MSDPPYAYARARATSAADTRGKRCLNIGASCSAHAASIIASCASTEYADVRDGIAISRNSASDIPSFPTQPCFSNPMPKACPRLWRQIRRDSRAWAKGIALASVVAERYSTPSQQRCGLAVGEVNHGKPSDDGDRDRRRRRTRGRGCMDGHAAPADDGAAPEVRTRVRARVALEGNPVGRGAGVGGGG